MALRRSLRRRAGGALRRSACALALAACLAACGSGGVEGLYVGQGEAFFDSLTFRQDGTVDVVLIGVRHQGTFTADRDGVTLTAPGGEQSRLTLDSNGCLTHQFVGTYCRDGASPGAAASGAGQSSELAQAYEATTQEGRIRLEFGAAGTVRLTMIAFDNANLPGRLSFDASYETSGDEVTIRLPDNERLLLARRGRDLEGTMDGETVRFVGQ